MIRDFLVPNSPSTAYGGPPPLTQGRLSRADISVCIISLILIHLSTTKLQLITLPLHECNFTVLRGKEKLHVGIVKECAVEKAPQF